MNLKDAFSVKGYDQLDLLYQESNMRSATAENNRLRNFEKNLTKGVGIRAIVNGKIGFAYTTDFQKLQETVKQAIKLAKFSNLSVTLKSYKKYAKPKGIFDKKVTELGDERLIDALQSAVSFVKKNNTILTEATIALSEVYAKYLNSEGLDLEAKGTGFSDSISINYKNIEAGWTGGSRNFENRILKTTQNAVDLAKNMSKKGKIKTGKYNVIFHPFALQQMLSYGLYPSFDADFVQKGTSKLAGKIGEQIFDEKLTINDNGILDAGLSSAPFDGEGVPSQNTPLVEKGVLRGFLYDLIRAQNEKRESTGNAVRNFSTLPEIGVTNFQIFPGKIKDITSEVDKGLLLYQPLNPHSTNPVTGDFSLGVMEALWIENGEIKFAPKHIMISGNIFELLKNITFIGRDVIQTGSLVSPSIVAQTQVIGD